jgi:hypothetical protein
MSLAFGSGKPMQWAAYSDVSKLLYDLGIILTAAKILSNS